MQEFHDPNRSTPQADPGLAVAHRRLLGQKGCVVWFTGLSGSGKSTLAQALERRLVDLDHPAYVLDGDNIRRGLSSDLDFSPQGREENIRRVAEVTALFADAGLIAIAAFISPYRNGRRLARSKAPQGRFFEIFLDAPLEVCLRRDPKGLYKKAQAGEISQFTGIDAPYEVPEHPELVLPTHLLDVQECVARCLALIRERGCLSP